MINPRDYSSRAREEAVPYDRSLTVAAPNFAISQRLYRGRLAPTNQSGEMLLVRHISFAGDVASVASQSIGSPSPLFERGGIPSLMALFCGRLNGQLHDRFEHSGTLRRGQGEKAIALARLILLAVGVKRVKPSVATFTRPAAERPK